MNEKLMLTGEQARNVVARSAAEISLLYLELVFEINMSLSDKMRLRQYSHDFICNVSNPTAENLLNIGFDFSKKHAYNHLRSAGKGLGTNLCSYYLARTYPQLFSKEDDYIKLRAGLHACMHRRVNKDFKEADEFWK